MSALVLFHKQLGDVVLLEPALRAIARQTGDKVALHGTPLLQTLTELMPHVEWVAEPRKARYSDLWVFETGSRPAWEAFRAHAGEKHLRVRKLAHVRWFHHAVFRDIQVREHRNVHNALFFLRGVEPEAEFAPPRLERPPEGWRHPELPETPFLAVNMSASLQQKAWDPAKWRAALQRMRWPIVALGAGPEWVERHVAEATEGLRVLNLTNRTNLRQFFHAISAARMHLSVEGAGAHLAMAFDVPSVAIFSAGNAANPLNWYAPGPQARVLIDPAAKWGVHGEPIREAGDLVRCVEELAGNL